MIYEMDFVEFIICCVCVKSIDGKIIRIEFFNQVVKIICFLFFILMEVDIFFYFVSFDELFGCFGLKDFKKVFDLLWRSR